MTDDVAIHAVAHAQELISIVPAGESLEAHPLLLGRLSGASGRGARPRDGALEIVHRQESIDICPPPARELPQRSVCAINVRQMTVPLTMQRPRPTKREREKRTGIGIGIEIGIGLGIEIDLVLMNDTDLEILQIATSLEE
jgi:hypothetical protein